MKKIALISLLTLTTSSFAADTIIFNKTRFPMQVTYYTCTQIPHGGTKCDDVPAEKTIAINPLDGNGKNYQIIPLDDMDEIRINKAVIKNDSKLTTYNLSCNDMSGGTIMIDNMGGTPVLVCQYSYSYSLPTE